MLFSENLIIKRESLSALSFDYADLTCELDASDHKMSALESPPTMPSAWSTTVEPWVSTSANVLQPHHQLHHHPAYQPYPHQG